MLKVARSDSRTIHSDNLGMDGYILHYGLKFFRDRHFLG